MLREVFEKGKTDLANALSTTLKSGATTIDQAAVAFERAGNNAVANWIRYTPGAGGFFGVS